MSKPTASSLHYWPAALRISEAAAYCGWSVESFKKICPVKPFRVSDEFKSVRYSRAALDDWISSLSDSAQTDRQVRKFGEDVRG